MNITNRLNTVFKNQTEKSILIQCKAMKKYLIKNSFTLFIIYMLSSIMLVTIYDNASWNVLIVRSITIAVFAFLVFIMNANIIIYYKSLKLRNPLIKNIEKKIFITGYVVTIIIFVIQHSILYALIQSGYNVHMPKLLLDTVWWKAILLLAYISLMQYTFIYLMQNFTLSQYEKNRIELQLLQLKNSNAENTNQLLKQQIQPHFLFNALNTLKSLIHKNPNLAEDYLINLSDFLRASFNHHNSGLATINKEIEICNNYMDMQKIRFGNALNYQIDDSVLKSEKNEFLPIFSIQPLVENAIKHNIATNSEPLNIIIRRENDFINITNNKQLKKSIDNSTGNGLNNLKERYKILTNDEIIVMEDNETFNVSIKIINK